MVNASVAIQVLPQVEERQVVPIVDRVIEHIQRSGLKYFVGPFETVVEGNFDKLMELVKECQETAVEAGAPGVISYIKIFYNPVSGVLGIGEKVDKYHEK